MASSVHNNGAITGVFPNSPSPSDQSSTNLAGTASSVGAVAPGLLAVSDAQASPRLRQARANLRFDALDPALKSELEVSFPQGIRDLYLAELYKRIETKNFVRLEALMTNAPSGVSNDLKVGFNFLRENRQYGLMEQLITSDRFTRAIGVFFFGQILIDVCKDKDVPQEIFWALTKNRLFNNLPKGALLLALDGAVTSENLDSIEFLAKSSNFGKPSLEWAISLRSKAISSDTQPRDPIMVILEEALKNCSS